VLHIIQRTRERGHDRIRQQVAFTSGVANIIGFNGFDRNVLDKKKLDMVQLLKCSLGESLAQKRPFRADLRGFGGVNVLHRPMGRIGEHLIPTDAQFPLSCDISRYRRNSPQTRVSGN